MVKQSQERTVVEGVGVGNTEDLTEELKYKQGLQTSNKANIMKTMISGSKLKTPSCTSALKSECTIDIQTLLNKNSSFSRAMNIMNSSRQASKSFRTPKVGGCTQNSQVTRNKVISSGIKASQTNQKFKNCGGAAPVIVKANLSTNSDQMLEVENLLRLNKTSEQKVMIPIEDFVSKKIISESEDEGYNQFYNYGPISND